MLQRPVPRVVTGTVDMGSGFERVTAQSDMHVTMCSETLHSRSCMLEETSRRKLAPPKQRPQPGQPANIGAHGLGLIL